MFISIQIVSSLIALLVLLVLFTYLLRLKYFKHKYIRLFMKLWIDLAFLNFILAIANISIPIQNNSLFYSILFIAYFGLFYYWKKTSVGSFMYYFDKIKEKNSAKKDEKVKLEKKLKSRLKIFRNTMYIFLAYVLLNMFAFPGHQLNDGSFDKTEVEGYMVNTEGNILMDYEGDGNFYMGYFDKYGNDSIPDEVRYDLNRDNKVDLIHRKDGENIGEYLIDYSEQKGIMIFFAIIFFIFIFIKGKNSKVVGKEVIASILLLAFSFSLLGDYKRSQAYVVPDCLDPLYTDGVLEGYFDDCDEYSGGVFIPLKNMEAVYGDDNESTEADETIWDNSSEEYIGGWSIDATGNSTGLEGITPESILDGYEDDGEQEYIDTDFGYHGDRLNYDPIDDSNSNVEKYTDKDWEKTEEEDRKVIRELEEQQEKARQEAIRKEEARKQEIKKQNKLVDDIKGEIDSLGDNSVLNQMKDMVQNDKDEKKVKEILTPGAIRANSSKKQREADKATIREIENMMTDLKDGANIAKEGLEYFGENIVENKLEKLIKKHGRKSKEVTDRIKGFKKHIEKLKLSGKAGALSGVKVNKAGIRGVGSYYKKTKKTFGKNMKTWSKAGKRLGTTLKVLGNIGTGISTYGDYHDFKNEFNGDKEKAVSATIIQQGIGSLVSSNPIDTIVGVLSSGVALMGYPDKAARMGDFTVGGVAKNTIKDSLGSSYKEIGQVISSELKRFKSEKGIINKSGALITGGITATYSLGVAAVKVPLELVVSVTKSVGNAAVGMTKSIVNLATGLFKWRSGRY